VLKKKKGGGNRCRTYVVPSFALASSPSRGRGGGTGKRGGDTGRFADLLHPHLLPAEVVRKREKEVGEGREKSR